MATDKLFYYSGSDDKVPGEGTKENVNKVEDYVQLSMIKDWRKKLDDFWVAPFKAYGKRWNTMEHLFQGIKVNMINPDLGYTFSLDSGSDLSKADGSVARANRNIVIFRDKDLALWEQVKDSIMLIGLYCKFTQHEDMKQILLATKSAELWHDAHRILATRSHTLETIREELTKITE